MITGGSAGIGLAIAREFLELGAHTALVARDRKRLEWTVNELAEGYPDCEVYGLAMDLSYPEELGEVPAWVADRWDGLDVLVNNVGTNIRKRALDFDLGEYQSLMDANLTSCFELSRLCHALLREGDEPAVVNISSVAGLTHMRTGAPYAMSKAGIIQLTRNLACEWAPDGIRVNCLAPWYIETPMTEDQRPFTDADLRSRVERSLPLRRMGQPIDIANMVLFLASDESAYCTGQAFTVDGGVHA